MADTLPICSICKSALCAARGGAVCFHTGKARTRKDKPAPADKMVRAPAVQK